MFVTENKHLTLSMRVKSKHETHPGECLVRVNIFLPSYNTHEPVVVNSKLITLSEQCMSQIEHIALS